MLTISIRNIESTLKKAFEDISASTEAVVISEKAKALANLVEATPVDTGRAREAWRTTESGIVNDTPYISELNGGSSQQSPKLFIERTLLQMQSVKASGTIVTNH